MKDTKRQLHFFTIYESEAIASHLSQMAADGWMIERADGALWTYRRIKPVNLQFAVTYFAKTHALDPEPSEELQLFWEFCEHTGWKLAVSAAQLQIFYNEAEDACPIETDPLVQVQNIHNAARKNILANLSVGLFLGLMNLMIFFFQLFENPLDTLSDAVGLWSFCLWNMYLVCSIREPIRYYRWYRKAQKTALEESRLLPFPTDWFGRILGLLILLIAVWMSSSLSDSAAVSGMIFAVAYAVFLSIGVVSLMRMLKRKKVSAKKNIIVTMSVSIFASFLLMFGLTISIIKGMESGYWTSKQAAGTYEYDGRVWEYYEEELPLTVSDLTGKDVEGYSCELSTEKTIFAAVTEAAQIPRFDAADYKQLSRLEYKIVKAEFLGMFSILKKAALSEHRDEKHGDFIFTDHYESIDASVWEADEAYQLYWSDSLLTTYLLVWDETIVEISFWGEEPSEEQMRIVKEKLTEW